MGFMSELQGKPLLTKKNTKAQFKNCILCLIGLSLSNIKNLFDNLKNICKTNIHCYITFTDMFILDSLKQHTGLLFDSNKLHYLESVSHNTNTSQHPFTFVRMSNAHVIFFSRKYHSLSSPFTENTIMCFWAHSCTTQHHSGEFRVEQKLLIKLSHSKPNPLCCWSQQVTKNHTHTNFLCYFTAVPFNRLPI